MKNVTASDAQRAAELARLPLSVRSIVVHPDLIADPAPYRALGRRLVIENMDNRKAGGRFVSELEPLFAALPEAGKPPSPEDLPDYLEKLDAEVEKLKADVDARRAEAEVEHKPDLLAFDRVVRGGSWDGSAFVDLVEDVYRDEGDPRRSAVVWLQRIEWRVLFESCARGAVGR